MHVERVPNRGSRPAFLLRESYREDGKVKKRTFGNISHLPPEQIDGIRRVLKGLPPATGLEEAFEITRSLPHGHVAAVLGTLRSLGLEELVDSQPSRRRNLVIAMVAARVIEPASKLAASRELRAETCSSSLGEVCRVDRCDEDDLYDAMDWLIERQGAIERGLAERHLQASTLVLYDVSSAAFEGKTCPLGAIGHARDGVKGRRQIVYGLLTTTEGIPVAIEVFKGNAADPTTLSSQIQKLKGRFDLSHVVLAGDRGMITKARIQKELKPAGLDWITALRAPALKVLLRSGPIQLSFFDEHDMAEISHPEYPEERFIVCKNPQVGEDRRRTREELLAATERDLEAIVVATKRPRRPLRGRDHIAVRASKALGRHKVGKHFEIDVQEDSFSYAQKEAKIAEEAALDGFYVVRTNVPQAALSAEAAVSTYKRLDAVERAFRAFNSDLDVRPIHHRLEDRVRAHLLICMLAYYVMWHMADRLAPILFKDHDRQGAEAKRSSPVASAERSDSALSKARSKRNQAGEPVHSFATLLKDLATVVVNRIQPAGLGSASFQVVTRPTDSQRTAFELLGVSPRLGYA
jgi:transposase